MSDLKNGLLCKFSCSHQGIRENVDLRQIRYLIPVHNQRFSGYYEVKSFNTKAGESLRIEFELCNYHEIDSVVEVAIHNGYGVPLNYSEFRSLCYG